MASLGIVAIYAFLACISLVKWGVDLPLGLLGLALVIVVSGVLLGKWLAQRLTAGIGLFILAVTYLEVTGIVPADLSWRQEGAGFGSAIVYVATLLIISTVAWLFNREIQRSLQRALESEQALREERDGLELRVAQRTEQLRQVQYQRRLEMHRFADFGRHAYGLFHDLMNPLTAQGIQLERLHAASKDSDSDTSHLAASLQNAIKSTKRMEGFVVAVRKQFAGEEHELPFVPEREIHHVMEVLAYKARKQRVALDVEADSTVVLNGWPVRFYKLVLNLTNNAVDAFSDVSNDRKRTIEVRFFRHEQEFA